MDFNAAHNAAPTREHNMVRVNQTALITTNYNARLICLLRTRKKELARTKLNGKLERSSIRNLHSAFIVGVIYPEPKPLDGFY